MLRGELYNPWFANIVDKGDSEWGFEIISGDYIGTVIQIKSLDFPDKGENLAVDYHTIKMPEGLSEESFQDEKFQLVFETILNDILTEALDNYKNESNRNNNTQEPDSQ